MSALGQKRTCAVLTGMSPLPPKADICSAQAHVRFVPEADIREMTLQKQKDRLKTLAAFLKSVSRRGPVNQLPVREPIPPEDCI